MNLRSFSFARSSSSALVHLTRPIHCFSMVGDGGGSCRVAYLKWNQFINPAAATIIITVSWPARANHPWEGLFIYPVYVDDGVGGWPLISVNKTNIHRI